MSPLPVADRLGVCSWSLQPSGPAELIEKINAIGIKKVQLALDPLVSDAAWSDAAAMLADAGIEIASGIKWFWRFRRVSVMEEEILHLGSDEEREAAGAGLFHRPAQNLARVAGKRSAVGLFDVTEHPRGVVVVPGPSEGLECVCVGPSDHVQFPNSAEPIDGRAVEDHALLRQLQHIGRSEHLRTINLGVQLTVVIGDVKDDVWLLSSHTIRDETSERGQENDENNDSLFHAVVFQDDVTTL